MPFKSQAQRSFLAIHHPDVAHKFAKDGSTAGKKLPYKVSGKRGGIGGGGPLGHMFGKGK
jgi:hypothetical protein